MVREDLKAAGIASETDSGRVDFHSLRVSFASNLGRSGVPIQTARQLMRHSSVELTARVYTKLELHDLEGAVQRLPGLSTGPETQAAKATGTDGGPADNPKRNNAPSPSPEPDSLPRPLPPRADASGLFVAIPGKVAASTDAGKNPRFPRRNVGNPRKAWGTDNGMSLTGKAPRVGLEPTT